jgi:hypothetical protein
MAITFADEPLSWLCRITPGGSTVATTVEIDPKRTGACSVIPFAHGQARPGRANLARWKNLVLIWEEP